MMKFEVKLYLNYKHLQIILFFSFGRALLRLGEYEKAKDQLWKARELEPNNKQTIKEIKLVRNY